MASVAADWGEGTYVNAPQSKIPENSKNWMGIYVGILPPAIRHH